MISRLFYNWRLLRPASKPANRFLAALVLALSLATPGAWALGDAPSWMHTAANAPLPEHDEKTDAVLLYSERSVTVVSADKIKIQVREAYRILRPSGHDYGMVAVPSNQQSKVSSLHAWCIPERGKDYEVKEKDAIEVSPPKVEGGELISDVRYKVLRIPAATPGSVVGYEYQLEKQPLVLQDSWEFQQEIPAVESHYSLQLPAGWEYRVFWINFPEVKPTQANGNQVRWDIANTKAILPEKKMPPLNGVAGQMIVSFFPSGGAVGKSFDTWEKMGSWYQGLTEGRKDVSPEMQQKVSALTASAPTTLGKIQLIAQFMQHDIRYVAIELGIGGLQPNPAAEVFVRRYGDCKDKATLMSAMLHAIGVDSYYVLINASRGAVTAAMPAHASGFNHVILAIRLPDDAKDPSLLAVANQKQVGRILFFDPTNELAPFGQIGGYLQSNYGLLVTPSGGELMQLPEEPPATNGVQRSAKLVVDASGGLRGDVREVHVGDAASSQRDALRSSSDESDRLRPIENVLGASVTDYHIVKAEVSNLQHTDQPFAYDYSFEADHYAKTAGNLLLLRPRVLGTESSSLLETKEPRKFPIEFDAPRHDTDVFEIALPAGFQVDELPETVDIDLDFVSYHSRSEVVGNTIRYTRSFELKQATVPLTQTDQLKNLYRVIASDERNMAVLKPK